MSNNIRRRPIDIHEDAICAVIDMCFYGTALSDECSYDVALHNVAPEYSLTPERLDQLTRTWCAIAGIAVPA
jgi:hypothetical protein